MNMLNNDLLVSIIIPVYNVENFLDRCIKSVVNQDYKNLEIILINDGSTDSSGAICRHWLKRDKRIQLIEQKNAGLSAARNTGIEYSKGSYFAFIDSDDWVAKDFISGFLNTALKYDADIVCQGWIYSDGEKETKPSWVTKESVLKDSEALYRLIEGRTLQSHVCTKFFKRNLFENTKFPVGKVFEDVYTMHKLFLNSKTIVLSPLAHYYYFQRSDSISNQLTFQKQLYWIDALASRLDDISAYHLPYKDDLKEMLISQMAVVYSLAVVQHSYSKEDLDFHSHRIEKMKRFLKNPRTKKAVSKYASKSQYLYFLTARNLGFKSNLLYKQIMKIKS